MQIRAVPRSEVAEQFAQQRVRIPQHKTRGHQGVRRDEIEAAHRARSAEPGCKSAPFPDRKYLNSAPSSACGFRNTKLAATRAFGETKSRPPIGPGAPSQDANPRRS